MKAKSKNSKSILAQSCPDNDTKIILDKQATVKMEGIEGSPANNTQLLTDFEKYENSTNSKLLVSTNGNKSSDIKAIPVLLASAQCFPKKCGNANKNCTVSKSVISRTRTLGPKNLNNLNMTVAESCKREENGVCDINPCAVGLVRKTARKIKRKAKLKKISPLRDQAQVPQTENDAFACVKGGLGCKLTGCDEDKFIGNIKSESDSSCSWSTDVSIVGINSSSSDTKCQPSNSSSCSSSDIVVNTSDVCKKDADAKSTLKDGVKRQSRANKNLKPKVTSRPSMLQDLNKKKMGQREMTALYRNLKEISWAQDKQFTTLLKTFESARHSDRLLASNVSPDRSNKKNLLKLRVKKDTPKKKKQLAKKCLLSTQRKPHNSLTAIAKKKLNSAKIARNKKFQYKQKISVGKHKPLQKTLKKHIVSAKRKTKSVPEKKTVVKRKKPESESDPVPAKKCKTKLSPKTDSKTSKITVSSTKTAFQEFSIWGNIFQNSTNNLITALQSQELRVTLEPLDNSELWPQDCNVSGEVSDVESYTRRSLQQRMLRVFTGIDPRYISSVLRDVTESLPANGAKNSRKRKYDEESVRSSVRQSECAFRYKEIVVKKQDNYIQIVLVPSVSKQNALTIEAMKELKDAFMSARKDSNCKAVLFNSSGSFFCSGIDLSQLQGSNKKHAAEEMAVTIRDLILTLALFPKPVIAAVNGYAIGLGVTILTFCDIVLSSDKATFCIPATKLGYVPEGGAMLTLPQVVGSTVALEMLLQCRNLTAQQALKYGLVSEVIWPTRLMEEVVPRIVSLVQQPLHIMEATKMMVRCHLWERLAVQLNHEWRLLPSQWLSAVCQQNIKKQVRTKWQCG